MSRLLTLLVVLGLTAEVSASAKKYYVRSQPGQVMDEIQNLIDDLKVEASNHETEIRRFQEQLSNQEVAVDSLWKQLNETNQGNKDKIRSITENLEMKVANLEGASITSHSEIQQLKTHLNESKDLVVQQKQKIHNMEKVIEVQNQNIEHLQAALQALMDALQIKDVAVLTENASTSGSVYQVKPGDSLEKIARKNHTSVNKLKEINHLTDSNDLIIVGQKLKLPE